MDEEVLLLILKRGLRVRQIRRLLQGRISKQFDRVCTRAVLELVVEKTECVVEKALALSRVCYNSVGPYHRTDFSLSFLGQFFWRPAVYASIASTEIEEDAEWNPECFPYESVEEDEPSDRSLPPPPSPSVDPAQILRLDEDLLLEVLKRISVQALCELIAGRSNRWFCNLCEKALRWVVNDEVLKVVKRALALDRLLQLQKVDPCSYRKCSSKKLRSFPSPVLPSDLLNRYPTRCVRAWWDVPAAFVLYIDKAPLH